MVQQAILSGILDIGVVPVVRTSSAESAIRAIQAIFRGGIRAGRDHDDGAGRRDWRLEKMADKFGDKIVVGAGTVLDPETARACMLAGAQFFVTPALNVKTIEMAQRYSKAILPGALTPTEVLTAWDAGADAVKMFPCSAVGGPKYIRALKGPFPQIEMIPTGGVNLETSRRHSSGRARARVGCGRGTHGCEERSGRSLRSVRGKSKTVPASRKEREGEDRGAIILANDLGDSLCCGSQFFNSACSRGICSGAGQDCARQTRRPFPSRTRKLD